MSDNMNKNENILMEDLNHEVYLVRKNLLEHGGEPTETIFTLNLQTAKSAKRRMGKE